MDTSRGKLLDDAPGVTMLAPFGSALHVSGTDEAALETAIEPWRHRPDLTWRRIGPSLEDVFIFLIGRAPPVVS